MIKDFKVFEFGNIIAGFSLGKEINYHPSSDINFEITKEALKNLGLAGSALKIRTEHKDNILIDRDDEPSDAIISTKARPIILSPADCIGLILIDEKTNIYGLCHIGRAGVGYNIVEKFIKKFLEVETQHQDLKFIISPNIDSENYPHNSDAFIYTNGKSNWWFNNQELLHKKNNIFYPDLENAVTRQIKESGLKENEYEIISSGLSTFTTNMHSNSRDTRDNIQEKRRNLVFVGIKD